MASLVEYSLLNGVDNDLNTSIQSVGGNTEDAVGVVDLAAIIRSQLVSNKAIGEGIYDNWLFGTPETNNIYEEPTDSTNAAQSTVIANAIKDVYETMTHAHKSVVYIVDSLPETEKSLSAIYLLKNTIPETSIQSIPIELGELTTFPNHVGNAVFEENILIITPDTLGQVNALCGWNNLNYFTEEFDQLVINTNLITRGKTGVSYSFDGVKFYKIDTDNIILSSDTLIKQGVKKISQFVIHVDSINEVDECTKIYISDIHLDVVKKSTITHSIHYYIREGKNIRQIDAGNVNIDFNQLFYATREEFIENKNKINDYHSALEDMLKKQFGSFLESGEVSIEDSIKNLELKCNELDQKIDQKIADIPVASYEMSGLMTAADKRKLDSILTMEYSDLDEILTL